MEKNYKRKNPNPHYQDQGYNKKYGGKPGKKMNEKDNYSLQASLIQAMMEPQLAQPYQKKEHNKQFYESRGSNESHGSHVVDLTNEREVLDVGSRYFKEEFLFYPWKK